MFSFLWLVFTTAMAARTAYVRTPMSGAEVVAWILGACVLGGFGYLAERRQTKQIARLGTELKEARNVQSAKLEVLAQLHGKTIEMLAEKTGTMADAPVEVIANAANTVIDQLRTELTSLRVEFDEKERHKWPRATPSEIAALADQLKSLRTIDWADNAHLAICYANPSDCHDIATDLARAISEAKVLCSLTAIYSGMPGYDAQNFGMWIFVGEESLKSPGEVIQMAIKSVLKLDVGLFGPWEGPPIHCIYLFITRKTQIGQSL